MTTRLLRFILVLVVMYLLASFYQADFNITRWNEEVRFGLAYLGGVMLWMIFIPYD